MNTGEDVVPSRADTGITALQQVSDFIVYHYWWVFIGISSSLQIQVIEGILLRSLQDEREAKLLHSSSKLRGQGKMSRPTPLPPKSRLDICDSDFYFSSASAEVFKHKERKFRDRVLHTNPCPLTETSRWSCIELWPTAHLTARG